MARRWNLFVLLVFTMATTVASAEPVNVVRNGGFEQGLSGWTPAVEHRVVEEPGGAHSGDACLTGEVTQPLQALQLKQRVQVKEGNRYAFEVFARGTNRTKLVLWVLQPGAPERESAASWDKITAKWQRYTTPLTAQADGELELHIIAPSSHGAPAGRIWIDDVAVWETVMPPLTCVSQGEGFNDQAGMAVAGDGSIHTAWLSFRDGRDTLQAARYARRGNGFERTGARQIVGGEGTYVLGVEAVATDKGVAIVWAGETDGNWDIHTVSQAGDVSGEPMRVSRHDAVDVDPAVAHRAGRLWIAWESNRSASRQICVASVEDGTVSEPVIVSQPETSAYDPSVAITRGGQVYVAWHAFSEGSYDIFLSRRSADGSFAPPRRLTTAPSIDRHASLATHGEDLWLVYENTNCTTYHTGATNLRRLIVARVTDDGLVAPESTGGPRPLESRCEAGTLAFDKQGRIYLAMLRPRLPRAGWDVFLTTFGDGRWTNPVPVSLDKGLDRRPCLAMLAGEAILAFQADNMPRSWNDVDLTAEGTSNIYLAASPLPRDAGAVALPCTPLVESPEPFEPASIRIARGEDAPTETIQYEGETLTLLIGQLHEHTDISVCNRLGDQSVDETYQNMRDIHQHDFACATDHGYNINAYYWGYLAKQARTNTDVGRFIAFLAEEWTSSFEEYGTEHPFGFYGHHNVILADAYFPKWYNARGRQTPADVWEDLRKRQADFVVIPHQIADTGNVPVDWNYTDEIAQPVAEIFQTRGSYEYKGAPREAGRSTPGPGYFLQDAWARGIVIGVIASPDHGGGYGKACVFAEEPTRASVLEAIRQRRCYGTTAAKIFLDVRVDGHLMGEKLEQPAGDSVTIDIETRCPANIDRIEVCRNNHFIHAHRPEASSREAKYRFVDRDTLPGRSYYYVRVIQTDEEIAWSSPVWFVE